MANTATQTARNAENDDFNVPGMCLQVCRTWAGIPARYPDAATAWRNTNDRHRDRRPPRGAAVYWTGGSRGFGHIAISLGQGAGPFHRRRRLGSRRDPHPRLVRAELDQPALRGLGLGHQRGDHPSPDGTDQEVGTMNSTRSSSSPW